MFNLGLGSDGTIKNDTLSGLTVALALVPEAVAFAIAAKVGSPLVGLYAAFIVCLITAIFGGRPGMISGATGALAVVVGGMMTELKSDFGLSSQEALQYLFAVVIVMGIIQIFCGIGRLGKFVRMIPHPVMLGFVNGLAIVIGLAQLGAFHVSHSSDWLEGGPMAIMIGLVLLTMLIIHFLPKLTKAVPSSLVAIVVVSLLVHFCHIDTPLVRSMSDDLGGGLPSFSIPKIGYDWTMVKLIIKYAFTLAAIGLIESLMTLTLIDELTETRGRGNKECMGQGLANVVTGFFGGMGGCAMIGQSMINIKSGGRGRLSGITAGLALLAFIVLIPHLIGQIPMAALTGVMFIVVIATFEWTSIKTLGKIPKSDAFVIVLVTGVTVFTDLAIAVGIGIVVSALNFAWNSAKKLKVEVKDGTKGERIYLLQGHLFFASTQGFRDLFVPVNDPKEVYIDFANCRVFDHSGLDAIHLLAERYNAADKVLHLVHLSPECSVLLEKAGDLVEVNVMEDPKYHVALDEFA